MFNPQRDTKLPNGARVLSRYHSKEAGGWYYLAAWKDNMNEFVTWFAPNHDPGATCIGSYFYDYHQAEENFLIRAGLSLESVT